MAALITLSSDFGTRDSYVAEVKGVLLQLGPPDLRIVDLSHEIAAHDVREAAFFLRAAVPRFPLGTIHLAVIDPGVGSTRGALVAESGGQRLVGPDNGIFGWLLRDDARVHRLPDALRTGVSSTFHGRDVFAPVAAQLAHGATIASIGPELSVPVRLDWPEPLRALGRSSGEVVHVDRFGNLISNIERAALPQAPLLVRLAGQPIGPLCDHYAEVGEGEPLALVGSGGLLEIAVRNGSAARSFAAGVGARVDVERVSSPQL